MNLRLVWLTPKAALLKSAGEIVFIDVDRPKPRGYEALIEVKVCGICGSDLHAYRNLHPDIKLPIILGHEFSGDIVEVGEHVKGFRVGDRVCVEPLITCGECFFCKRGEYNRCFRLRVLGCQSDGAFTKYVAIDERWIHRLNSLSYEEGAMVEPLAVAIHAVERGGVKMGDEVAVLGAGAIGLLTLQVAKAVGASKVIATDLVDWRLKVAEELGADVVLNPSRDDVVKEALSITKGGVDVAFEAVGSQAVLQTALKIVKKGGVVAVIGVYEKPDVQLQIMDVVNKELTIKGTLVYCWDYEKAIDLIKAGRVNVKRLITHILPLEEIKRGFELMLSKVENVIKVQVKP